MANRYNLWKWRHFSIRNFKVHIRFCTPGRYKKSQLLTYNTKIDGCDCGVETGTLALTTVSWILYSYINYAPDEIIELFVGYKFSFTHVTVVCTKVPSPPLTTEAATNRIMLPQFWRQQTWEQGRTIIFYWNTTQLFIILIKKSCRITSNNIFLLILSFSVESAKSKEWIEYV